MVKENNKKEKGLLVVAQLLNQPVRDYVDKETGEELEMITIEEALTELLTKVREIHKKL